MKTLNQTALYKVASFFYYRAEQQEDQLVFLKSFLFARQIDELCFYVQKPAHTRMAYSVTRL
jgi:hypothetical protein